MTSKLVEFASPVAGRARVRGASNKANALLKDAILKAAEAYGDDGEGKDGLVGYCAFLARTEPKTFAQLLAKVMPMQLSGPDDQNGNPTAITVTIVDPQH